MRCEGFFELKFNLKYVNVLLKEYEMIKKLGGKRKWFCEASPNRHKLDLPVKGENLTLYKLLDVINVFLQKI